MNCFLLFNIIPKYDINLAHLDRQYLSIQKKIYENISISHEKSVSEINSAYKILKNAYHRAVHLLELHGFDIKLMDLKKILTYKDLENFLDLFEKADNVLDKTLLGQLLHNAQNEQKNIIKILSNKFSSKMFEDAIYLTVKLKYTMNLIEYIKNKIKNVA